MQLQLVGLFETKLHLKQQPEEALLQAVEFPLEDKKRHWGKLRLCGSLNRTEWFPEKLSFMICKVHHHEREERPEHRHPEAFCAGQFFWGRGGFEGQIHIDMESVKEIASLHSTLWMTLELSILQCVGIHLACWHARRARTTEQRGRGQLRL